MPIDLDNILRHLGEPPVDGIQMHPVTDDEVRALAAELRAARKVVEAARAYVRAEELDSPYAARS